MLLDKWSRRSTIFNVLLFTNLAFAFQPHNEVSSNSKIVKKNKKKLQFFLDVNSGLAGEKDLVFTYNGFARVLSQKTERYLDQLGLEFSENILKTQLTSYYQKKPRLIFYGSLPIGAVFTRVNLPLPDLRELHTGVGDISTGVFYQLSREYKNKPQLTLNFEVNSNTAKYSSLGDGFWGLNMRLEAKKHIWRSYFLTGGATYGYRFNRAGVSPGDVIGLSIGLGEPESPVWWHGAYKALALKTFKSRTSPFETLDSYLDLVFMVTTSSRKTGNMSLYFAGLNRGLSYRNEWGINWSLRIFKK